MLRAGVVDRHQARIVDLEDRPRHRLRAALRHGGAEQVRAVGVAGQTSSAARTSLRYRARAPSWVERFWGSYLTAMLNDSSSGVAALTAPIPAAPTTPQRIMARVILGRTRTCRVLSMIFMSRLLFGGEFPTQL